MNRRPSSAFTLIELLVVVSIIALLVSILLPSLARAREISKRAVCSVNLRTLGSATHIYATDYNGYIPFGEYGYPYFLTTRHGPWGVLFDAGIFDDCTTGNDVDRVKPGVADHMFCPSQRNQKFMQSTIANPTARAGYQGRYFYPPQYRTTPWAAKRLSLLPSASAFAADIVIYDSDTHTNRGVNVTRVDSSVTWFEWPGGVSFYELWDGSFTWQGLSDYWALEFDTR